MGTVILMVVRPLLRNGLKGVIKKNYRVHALEPPNLTALLNFDFEKETTPIVLVIDYNLVKDKNLLFIQNFIKKNPTVKIIGLFDSFLFQKIHNLLRIGVFGAYDKCVVSTIFSVRLNVDEIGINNYCTCYHVHHHCV